jgi:hypothetical protein
MTDRSGPMAAAIGAEVSDRRIKADARADAGSDLRLLL